MMNVVSATIWNRSVTKEMMIFLLQSTNAMMEEERSQKMDYFKGRVQKSKISAAFFLIFQSHIN